MDEYLHIWTSALKAFGWTPERIQYFVSRYMKDMGSEDSLFYHEDPAYYLTWEILSERAVSENIKRLSSESKGNPWELFEPIQNIINNHLGYYECARSNQPLKEPDWLIVKKEISEFLAKHGETMRLH